MMNIQRRLRSALLSVVVALTALMAVGSALASAHGNPEIAVTPDPAPPGAAIAIQGEGFEEDEEVSLTLEGISADSTLGSVSTDADGNFEFRVALPEDVAPGSYRIRAQAADATALADFRISQGSGGPQPAADHEASIGFHREASTGLAAGLLALAAALAVAGLALLRVRERVRAPEGH